MRASRAVLWVSSAVLAVAAVNHAVLASRAEGDVARHWAFVAINLGAAAIVARAPRWAVVPIALLALQQAYSHGSDLIASIRGPGPFDWASLGVLVFFPVLVTTLAVERRR